MKMRSILFIGIAGLLSACSTINYVGIETYNPAEVTFPENVAKVLIVNNAVPQPEDAGYEYTLQGERQDTCKAKADSALFDACRTLGEAIVEASYFNDVLLYHDGVRKDNQAFLDTKLTQGQVASLCDETGADAVISIDRLLFDMKKSVGTLGEGYVMGMIDVQMAGVIRSYVPDREAPLATVHMKDSIYWAESADYIGRRRLVGTLPEWVHVGKRLPLMRLMRNGIWRKIVGSSFTGVRKTGKAGRRRPLIWLYAMR